MARTRRLLIKRRVSTLFRRVFRRRSIQPPHYCRLQSPPLSHTQPFFTRLTQKLLPRQQYTRIGHGPRPTEPPCPAPKGHIAVYVGGKEEGDFEKVFVPVVYFNHPLFGELLRESEKEFGFNYPGGGITIPCRVSEFESIRTRIGGTPCRGGMMTWRKMCGRLKGR